MKTDWSHFAGKSGVLYFRTTIQTPEWTPFILVAEDLEKNKKRKRNYQIYRTKSVLFEFNTTALCGPSFPCSGVSEIPAQHGVLRLPLQMCSLITSTFVLEYLSTEFLMLPIATDYQHNKCRSVFQYSFSNLLQWKKKRNPPFTYLLTQLIKTSLERREERRCKAHFPADWRDALSKATKQERRRYEDRKHTEHASHVHGRKPRLGLFNQRHERGVKRESCVTKEQSVGTKPTAQKNSNKLLLSFEKREMKLSFLRCKFLHQLIKKKRKKTLTKLPTLFCSTVKSCKDTKRKLSECLAAQEVNFSWFQPGQWNNFWPNYPGLNTGLIFFLLHFYCLAPDAESGPPTQSHASIISRPPPTCHPS